MGRFRSTRWLAVCFSQILSDDDISPVMRKHATQIVCFPATTAKGEVAVSTGTRRNSIRRLPQCGDLAPILRHQSANPTLETESSRRGQLAPTRLPFCLPTYRVVNQWSGVVVSCGHALGEWCDRHFACSTCTRWWLVRSSWRLSCSAVPNIPLDEHCVGITRGRTGTDAVGEQNRWGNKQFPSSRVVCARKSRVMGGTGRRPACFFCAYTPTSAANQHTVGDTRCHTTWTDC